MRDCHHGRLARSCPECELLAALVDACHAQALAEREAERYRDILRRMVSSADDIVPGALRGDEAQIVTDARALLAEAVRGRG